MNNVEKFTEDCFEKWAKKKNCTTAQAKQEVEDNKKVAKEFTNFMNEEWRKGE
tara:strand:- start:3163 stop:3321 length:159 start_codon:yes stop_codon:yes gene_type:complete